MSAQEFKVGQRIIGPDYTRLPVGAEVNNVWRKVAPNDWRNANFPDNPHTDDDLHNPRPLTHLPDELTDWERELLAEVDAEDKDDLYVEPEPLKEGDAVLVWAKVVDPERDTLGDFAIDVMYGATFDRTFARLDAIVRPAEGQVPPWVEEEQKAESEAISNITAALRREGGMDYDAAHKVAASLYRAGVRITEGGAS